MSREIKEVVAVFDDEESLDNAVAALKKNGLKGEDFTVLGSEEAIKSKLGHRYHRTEELEDLPNIPRDSFYSRFSRLVEDFLPVPVLGSLGALSCAFVNPVPTVMVAAGAGTVLGAALGIASHAKFKRHLEEQIQRGGILLWVLVQTPEEEKAALEGLRLYSAHDVHTHKFAI